MIFTSPDHMDVAKTWSYMSPWLTTKHVEDAEEIAFLSGSVLSHLHLVLACGTVPQALLRDRLALSATEACIAHLGRSERAGALRDAVHFLRPGDLPGPAGEIALAWHRAVAQPISVETLQRALPDVDPAQLQACFQAGRGAPITRSAEVLETALVQAPRTEMAALILADAALAQALGWDHIVPLLAMGLKRADLRKRGADLRKACHRALVVSVIDALHRAAALAHRAAHLKAIAPKLRAKRAQDAIALFLSRDAVPATALPLPDRAARRLCERLIDLGGIRELTGRDTFRLYGV